MNECCFCENHANVGICSQCQDAEHRAFVDLKQELADAQSEIERKDALIEQMREALKWALAEARSTHGEELIKAALEAAEGGWRMDNASIENRRDAAIAVEKERLKTIEDADKARRMERMATALMAAIYANPAYADIDCRIQAVKCAIDGAEALIAELDRKG